MKFVLLVFVSFFILKADFLALRDRNHCVYNLEPKQNSSGWCYRDRNRDKDRCDRFAKIDDFIAGYYLDDNGNCILKKNLKITGLTQNQWDWNMALLGHFTGFTVLFLISFLSLLMMRK